MTNLADLIRKTDSLDLESTIYVRRPIDPFKEAVAVMDGAEEKAARDADLRYFLPAEELKKFVEQWRKIHSSPFSPGEAAIALIESVEGENEVV